MPSGFTGIGAARKGDQPAEQGWVFFSPMLVVQPPYRSRRCDACAGEFRRTAQRAPAQQLPLPARVCVSAGTQRTPTALPMPRACRSSDFANVIFDTTAYRSALSTIFLRLSANVGIAGARGPVRPSQVDTRATADSESLDLRLLDAKSGDRSPRKSNDGCERDDSAAACDQTILPFIAWLGTEA